MNVAVLVIYTFIYTILRNISNGLWSVNNLFERIISTRLHLFNLKYGKTL